MHVCKRPFAAMEPLFKSAPAYPRACADNAAGGERRPRRAHINSCSPEYGQLMRRFWIFKERKSWESHTQTIFSGTEVRWKECCSSHPERSSLAQLEHPINSILELDSAIELGQVVVIDPQQLESKGERGKTEVGIPFIKIKVILT